MLKEKFGICLYEENYYEDKIIKIQDEKPIEEISKVSNKKSIKKLSKELIEESYNESSKESDNESIKESYNESNNESTNESNNKSDNKSVNESDNKSANKSTTDWYDKNKSSKILTTIDNNNFYHKNKIGKLTFNDINNLINNIKNNTISEADTKKEINELNEIKKAEIKGKRLITIKKILLSLFDDLLKTILNNSNNNSNCNNNENERENKNINDNDNKVVNEDNNVNDDDDYDGDDDHDEQYYEIKQINNNFKEIDETKSFEDQIDIFKKIPWLNDYWCIEYYEDNKETNLRLFKVKLAHVLNYVENNLFKKTFGFTSVKLADKLINTTSKEKNQMLINDIEINRDKIFEQDKFSKFVIEPSYKRDVLLDTVKAILKFSETIQPYLT